MPDAETSREVRDAYFGDGRPSGDESESCPACGHALIFHVGVGGSLLAGCTAAGGACSCSGWDWDAFRGRS